MTGQILFAIPASLSTFAPPVGAFLDGHQDVMAQQFPAALGPFTAMAVLFVVVGNLFLAMAGWKSGTLPRWTGATFAAGTITCYLQGAALDMSTTGASLPTLPIGGALLAISGAGIAWTAIHVGHLDDQSHPSTTPRQTTASGDSPRP